MDKNNNEIYERILQFEERTSNNLNQIYLIKDSNNSQWYKAYEWSAYLLEFMTNNLQEKDRLKPLKKQLENTNKTIINVGFPLTSIEKFCNPNIVEDKAVDGNQNITIRIKSSALAGHISHCKENPNKRRTDESYKKWRNTGTKNFIENRKKYRLLHPEKYLIQEYKCNCEKCGKEYIINVTKEQYEKGKYKKNCSRSCANGHIVSEETKKKISNSVTSHYSDSVKEKLNTINYKICKNCGKLFILPKYISKTGKIRNSTKKYCDECYKIINKEQFAKAGLNNFHYGTYKGIPCDSSWELAFVIYHLDHGNEIKRCKLRLTYTYENKEYIYMPDFEINGKIYEIKGYENEKAKIKHKTFPNIEYINKDKILPILNYVIEKYGEKYWYLYDK